MIPPITTADVLPLATNVALIGLSISLGLCLYRLLIGPDNIDRLLALDTTSTNVIAMLIVLSIRLRTGVYLESVLVLALLAFVGTVAISKYLVRGKIIE
jgi:multicomponent K+:H+ antiporter subunit F